MRADLRETDATKTYVEWAIKNDFAVIDVNIPSHITNEGVRTCVPIWKRIQELTMKKDTTGYVEPDSIDLRAATTRELATYLWENYIEYVYFDRDSKPVFADVFSRVNDSTDIILMGIGAAYAGVVWLLSNEGMKPKTG
jgi:histone deacetylase 6